MVVDSFMIVLIVSFKFVLSDELSNFKLSTIVKENLRLKPKHLYMNSLCDRKEDLRTRDAITISPWTTGYPSDYISCVVKVEEAAYQDLRFVVTFKKMDLYPKTSGMCQKSRLDLFSGQSVKAADKISDSTGLCGTETSHVSYETKTNSLTLEYVTINLPHGIPQYFEAIITPFHYGTCKHDEFKCRNGKCVKENMLCDSYNNCGDDSDETNCSAAALTIAAIVGIVVGSVVFIAIIATICICFCCCGCCGMCGYERL